MQDVKTSGMTYAFFDSLTGAPTLGAPVFFHKIALYKSVWSDKSRRPFGFFLDKALAVSYSVPGQFQRDL